MFARVISLIGEENFTKIKNATILVVGLGGVGGYAVEALVRSGVGHVILIDHDIIDCTNLNRQIISLTSNIGCDKVKECQCRLNNINGACQVIPYKVFLNAENISMLDKYHIDYIIDACDTVNTKKILIDYSIKKNIPLISSMGTALKIDPTKLTIEDIRKTSYDPLAKIMRKYVNAIHTNKKIMVVSSTEKPLKNTELASMIFVPATAGLLCANYVIRDIINKTS